MPCYESEHYVFHYEYGSKAAQDIDQIAAAQEDCYRHICTVLGLSKDSKIHYYLCNSSEEVGLECERRFGEYTPYHGCTLSEHEIIAVYNSDLQCIGFHEDTHILMFTLGFTASSFLEEGAACAMDSLWWGIDNSAWVSYYRKNGQCPSVCTLLNLPREEFYVVEDHVSYPLAGSFVQYLLLRFGKDAFRRFYMAEQFDLAAQDLFGCTLSSIEQDYFRSTDLLCHDKSIYDRIDVLLKAARCEA